MNDYYDIKAEKRKIKLPTILHEKDFSKILPELNKTYHKMAFKLSFLCGLRISEVINLARQDFDKERKLIFIKQGKGGKDRYVPYPTRFITQQEINSNIPMPCGARALQIKFKKIVKKILKRDDLHYHNLRHSFATNLLNKGIPITDVQFWLGHSRLSTTAIYLKVAPDMAQKRYEELWS